MLVLDHSKKNTKEKAGLSEHTYSRQYRAISYQLENWPDRFNS